jgi:hypothetical protein
VPTRMTMNAIKSMAVTVYSVSIFSHSLKALH